MRRPSHRHRNLNWVPAPRSAWARRNRSTVLADMLPEPYRSELLAQLRQIQDAHERMVGYRVRRVEEAKIVVFKAPVPKRTGSAVVPFDAAKHTPDCALVKVLRDAGVVE